MVFGWPFAVSTTGRSDPEGAGDLDGGRAARRNCGRGGAARLAAPQGLAMQGPSHSSSAGSSPNASGLDTPRERRIVAWSGLAPDADVVAYLGALVWYGFDKEAAFENVLEGRAPPHTRTTWRS